MQNKNWTSEAVRDKALPAYEQLEPRANRAIAVRFSLGEMKYGRDNWRKGIGDVDWVRELWRHLEQHKLDELAGTDDEDDNTGFGNLGAIGWAVHALCWFRENDQDTYDAARGIRNAKWEEWSKQKAQERELRKTTFRITSTDKVMTGPITSDTYTYIPVTDSGGYPTIEKKY